MQPQNPDISQYAYNNNAKRWTNAQTGRFVSNESVVQEMRRHQTATYATLDNLTNALYRGSITLEQWQLAVASELKDAHLAQAMFAVGGRRNMTSVEFGRVGGTLRDEYGWLANFANDIAAGRVSQAQALARIKQYGNATQQSYWREYAQADKQAEYNWRTRPGETCSDCISLESGSPYKYNELPTYPGAGATRCRGNCNCVLERVG